MPAVAFSSWAFPDDPPERAVEFAHREGFDGIEFALLTDGLWAGEQIPAPREARRVAEACGELRRSVHAPIEQMALASPSASERRSAEDLLAAAIDAAAELGASVVVLHLRHGHDAGEPSWLLHAADPLHRGGELVAERGLVLGVENYGVGSDHADADYVALAGLIDRVAHPAVGMTLDTGHANVHLGAPAGVGRGVDLFADRIVHYHVHDNSGDWDAHLPVGHGRADFTALASADWSRSDAMLVLEIFPFALDDPVPGLRSSRDVLRGWLGR